MKNPSIFILGIVVIGLLSGCSSSNDDRHAATNTATDTVTTVRGIVATSPENTEPVDIDSFQVTTPEDGEPEDI
ncbi:MAG: hypothetical protein HY201_01110 [Nitrospirae bacterium]|nr:hypothetical protein [Candidatus Troglogloeales bacterium]MBI3598050.1 hypothetical protein [Candidatus Troglogloeales bacterium]